MRLQGFPRVILPPLDVHFLPLCFAALFLRAVQVASARFNLSFGGDWMAPRCWLTPRLDFWSMLPPFFVAGAASGFLGEGPDDCLLAFRLGSY